jgi:hypothetical protein
METGEFQEIKAEKCSGNWQKCFFGSGQGLWPLQGPSEVKCLVFFLKLGRSKYDPGKWPLQAIFDGHCLILGLYFIRDFQE